MSNPSPQIVLASTSPYRQALLSKLEIPFVTANPLTDETPLAGEHPQTLALRLAEAKARAVAPNFPNALIIGSDQVAVLGKQIFGKPGTHENAIKQLQALRGNTVNFYTALCLLNTHDDTVQITGVPTLVSFRDLSDAEIENYVRREQPYNCAGAAKSEGLGISLLTAMTGDDPNALVGLPLIALCTMLKNAGVQIL